MDSPAQEVTSGNRKPKWLRDTLKEADEQMDNPTVTFRKSKVPEKFCTYVAIVSNVREEEPTTYEEVADKQFGEMPWWKSMLPS